MADTRFPNSLRPGRRAGPAAAGFTLIELVVTIAIVGILAAIAISSYEFATVKARRGAAQSCLTEAAQYMERYYTTNLKYTDAPLPTCSSDVSAYYALSFAAGPADTSFLLQAVPQGRQASVETRCGTMTINEKGTRTPTTGCW